jgi:hypothetical protein
MRHSIDLSDSVVDGRIRVFIHFNLNHSGVVVQLNRRLGGGISGGGSAKTGHTAGAVAIVSQ